jgi:hypothetical protein
VVPLAKTPPDEGQALPLPQEGSTPRGVRSTSVGSVEGFGLWEVDPQIADDFGLE